MTAMPEKNNKSRRTTIAMLASLFIAACGLDTRVASPNGRIEFEFCVDDGGVPCYSVSLDGEAVVGVSRLGLEFKARDSLLDRFRVTAVERRSVDANWEQPWGERRVIRDNHNELLATFTSIRDSALAFRVRARVFDDGVGFRYEVGGSGDIVIVDEHTEFDISGAAVAHWQPGNGIVRYEHLYRSTSIDEIDVAHTPVTVTLPSGVHLSIHEAALVDYTAYVLRGTKSGLRTELRRWSDGDGVRAAGPLVTPWRTIQIADFASGLINSNLILNLNEPNALGDVSWVQPGKYVGIWWAIHLGQKTWHPGPNHGATTEEAKRHIDFAATYGFDGVLVEGWNKGWAGEDISFTEAYPDFDLQSVSQYARERGVYLIGHHETYGDVSGYEDQLEAAMDLYASVGVPQIKTGYVADAGKLRRRGENGEIVHEWHDGQYAVTHHLHVLQEAAKRKISINTHEPVKDTGLRRTYPNWLTREGSRGQEFAIWGETPNPPEHTVMLAYTRMLAGPMDFTPGIFDLHPKGPDSPQRIQTTLAKQLALYVVLYSPIQMVPDLRENYEARSGVFQFVVDVPTDWEESIALAGEVGDFVVIARRERGGDDWYLGAITDEEARSIELPLDFLDVGTEYIAEIYRDSEDANWDSNPYSIEIENQIMNSDSTLELKLVAGGGAAIRFRPKDEAA